MFYEIILGVIDDQRTIIVLVHDQLNGKSIGQRTYYPLHRSSNQLVYQNYQLFQKIIDFFFFFEIERLSRATGRNLSDNDMELP